MMRTPARLLWIFVVIVVLYEVSWTLHTYQSTSTKRSDLPKGGATEHDSHRVGSSWHATGQHAERSLTSESTYSSGADFPAQFPKKVWQTASEDGRIKWAKPAQTWKDLEGWDYQFLSDDDADQFVDTNFVHSPSIPTFWHKLKSHVIRADLLRYLIMVAKGGVYSDIDTTCLMHPDLWIPSDIDTSSVNAVVGIEYDDTTYPIFVWPISFSQWTLFAKPNHPIFQLAVNRVISNLEFLARRKSSSVDEFDVNKKEVLAATGPGMITDVIVQVIQDQGIDVTWESFHNITKPTVFGDVLVLPINGFAGNQKHSHSGNPAYGQKYVHHHFARSWYVRPGTQATAQKPIAEKHEKRQIDHEVVA